MFTAIYYSNELGRLIEEGDFQPTAENVSATLETAKTNYETLTAQTIEAKAVYDHSVDTLRSEHPMLQSQYKLDMCHDNIAELTAYLERDDISDEDRAEREAQLGGWQMFLEKNGDALEEDAEEMREAHKKHLAELDELKEKHEHLKEIVHEDGLLSWLF